MLRPGSISAVYLQLSLSLLLVHHWSWSHCVSVSTQSNRWWLKKNVAPGLIVTWGHTSTHVPLAKHEQRHHSMCMNGRCCYNFVWIKGPCCAIFAHISDNGDGWGWEMGCRNKFYVDNCLTSLSSTQEARSKSQRLRLRQTCTDPMESTLKLKWNLLWYSVLSPYTKKEATSCHYVERFIM